jgi:hypothetical protein
VQANKKKPKHEFRWFCTGGALPEEGRAALVEGIERFLINIEQSIKLQKVADATSDVIPDIFQNVVKIRYTPPGRMGPFDYNHRYY